MQNRQILFPTNKGLCLPNLLYTTTHLLSLYLYLETTKPPTFNYHATVSGACISPADPSTILFMDIPFDVTAEYDYTSNIPDECLEIIFRSLSFADRLQCSLVCRRWLIIEGRSHHRIAFTAPAEITPFIPSIFTRYDSVTKLALQCHRRNISINDDALALISLHCLNLTRIKLYGCSNLSDEGIATLGKNCKLLKKFSCGSCKFGAKGMNELLNHCSLEQLSVKRLRGLENGDALDLIGPGLASSSLKSICLKSQSNAQCFAPLLVESKYLKTLKLIKCSGEWDGLLKSICNGNQSLTEIRLEDLQVTNVGLEGVSECSKLEVLHLMKLIECTDDGLKDIALNCKQMRKLHINDCKMNNIGDQGLMYVAKNCPNLEELVLIGLNPSVAGLGWISLYSTKLERLAICGSDTIGDHEISCISAKTLALRKFCIRACPLLTNDGINSFAYGCPNLDKIKVKKCKGVTRGIVEYLKARRPGIELSLDIKEEEVVVVVEEGLPEEVAEMVEENGGSDDAVAESSNNGEGGGLSEYFMSRISLFGGNVAYSLRRWSTGNDNSSRI